MKIQTFNPLYLLALLAVSVAGYTSALTPPASAQYHAATITTAAPLMAEATTPAPSSDAVDITTLGLTRQRW